MIFIKHAYILNINEMRAAIAEHLNVPINNVTIHSFPNEKTLRIEAWVITDKE